MELPEKPSAVYASHRDYMARAQETAEHRCASIQEAALRGFQPFLYTCECQLINFSRMDVAQLGELLFSFPILLKPVMLLANVAERAIQRDLGIAQLNSYNTRLSVEQARQIAGYLKPFLPPSIELNSLCLLDKIMFVDKEIRKGKGNWERSLLAAMLEVSADLRLPSVPRKRKFVVEKDEFELDIAYPGQGEPIVFGIDVKRIEARRDIHKRADEIINKATKFKWAYPRGKFIAVVYYPFPEDHGIVGRRIRSMNVDAVLFADEHPENLKKVARAALMTGLGET